MVTSGKEEWGMMPGCVVIVNGELISDNYGTPILFPSREDALKACPWATLDDVKVLVKYRKPRGKAQSTRVTG
jgi:hypothetical protein